MSYPATGTPAVVPSEAERDAQLAYLFLRALLGLNIMVHGFSRVVAGPRGFAHGLVAMFQKTFLPGWSVYAFGVTLPFVEALLGMLLLLGMQTRRALLGGCLLILTLTFGSTLRQDWDAAGQQLLYGLVYAILLAFSRWNRWNRWNRYSLDALFGRTGSPAR